jgi:hypothetical protein
MTLTAPSPVTHSLYWEELERRLKDLRTGAHALSKVSGTPEAVKDGMRDAIATVERQMALEDLTFRPRPAVQGGRHLKRECFCDSAYHPEGH